MQSLFPRLALLAAVCSVPTHGLHAAEAGMADDEDADRDVVEVIGNRFALPGDAGAATKTNTPIIETPASVSVITPEMLRDRGALNLQEALRYSAGVMSDAYGLDNRTDSAVIRGTEFQSVLDGMRDQFNYYNTTRPDPYALERIEVLKGPASVLYGQGPVAGVVALVSKRPQAARLNELIASYGRFDQMRINADSTGALTQDGTWLYRVVGVLQRADSQVDYAFYDRDMIAPSVTWKPSDDLSWTLLTIYQNDDSRNAISFLPHSGTALPNPNGRIPVNRFTSEPDFDRFEATKHAATSLLEWKLSDVWSLHQNLRYADNDNPYDTLYPDAFSNPENPFLDEEQRTVARFVYAELRRQRDFTADHQAQARFSTGALSHHLLLGVDYARSRFASQAGYGYLETPFDLYAPEYGTPVEAPALGDTSVSYSRFTGVYAQNQMKFGQNWISVLGLRYDRATSEPGPGESFTDHDVTGRVGLMYHAASGWAPYASYSQSFQQNPYLDETGTPYDPMRGEQVEVGLKFQSPDERILATAAWFDLTEKNRLFYGLLGSTGLVDVDARGVEFEAIARVGDFDVIASYTYTDTEKREYTAVPPRHMASTWLKYIAGGLECGTGVRYLGSTTDDGGAIPVPAVSLFDAMLAYNYRDWRFALNATNLEDETYVTSCLVRGDCFYGNRGVVFGSVGYRF